MLLHKQEIIKIWLKALLAIVVWRFVIFYQKNYIDEPHLATETIKHEIANETYVVNFPETQDNTDFWEKEQLLNIQKKIITDWQRTPQEADTLKKDTAKLMREIETMIRTTKTLQDSLQSVTIQKAANTSRGYSSHESIVINYGEMKDHEFRQVLVHELWHIIDLSLIQGSSSKKNTQFTEFGEIVFAEDDPSLVFYSISRETEQRRKLKSKTQDFCSIYGMTNPFEDFAECLNLYLYHQEYFKSLKKTNISLEKKYNYIASLLWNNYIQAGKKKENLSKRYRDTTKLNN